MRYTTEQLLNMKPPSFLEKTKQEKKTLLRIEVSVTPTKTGIISLKEGENVHQVAKSFCKAYQLNYQMQCALESQLETHLQEYYRRQMLTQIVDKNVQRMNQKFFTFENQRHISVSPVPNEDLQDYSGAIEERNDLPTSEDDNDDFNRAQGNISQVPLETQVNPPNTYAYSFQVSDTKQSLVANR